MLKFNHFLFALSYYEHDMKQTHAHILLKVANTLDFLYLKENFLFTGTSRSPTPHPQPPPTTSFYPMAHLHQTPRSRMRGKILPFLNVFMTCTWISLSFYLTLLLVCMVDMDVLAMCKSLWVLFQFQSPDVFLKIKQYCIVNL